MSIINSIKEFRRSPLSVLAFAMIATFGTITVYKLGYQPMARKKKLREADEMANFLFDIEAKNPIESKRP